MAKVCFQMVVFNGMPTLPAAIEAIRPYGPVIVTEGPVKHYQDMGYEHSTDGTIDCLKSYIPRKHIVHGKWAEKLEMFQCAQELIPPDTTHVWEVDADEVWKEETIQQILLELDEVDSMSFKAWSFFGGLEYYMTGFEENFEVHRIKRWEPGCSWVEHRPPTVRRRDGVLMRDLRHWNHVKTDARGWRFHHYSYVFPLATLAKARYYAQLSPGLHIPNWFDRVFMPWVTTHDMTSRKEIEDIFDGVHNWPPQVRGPCRSMLFYGSHPLPVQARLAYWSRLIEDQRRMVGWAKRHDAQLLEGPGW